MKPLGVILSGGKSSRMGTDKGLLEYEGKPLIEYSIELLQSYCSDIIISTNSLDYLQYGFQTIPDLIPEIGPLGGIYSVLTMLKARNYFIISCDTPHTNIEFAKELINKKDKAEIVVPVHSGNKKEPLFGLYSYSVLNKAKIQIEQKNFKLMDLLRECDTYYHKVSEHYFEQTPKLFKNVNSPKDVR